MLDHFVRSSLLWICNCINCFSRNFNNVFVFILILLSYRSAKLENLQKSLKKVKFITLHYETKPSVIQRLKGWGIIFKAIDMQNISKKKDCTSFLNKFLFQKWFQQKLVETLSSNNDFLDILSNFNLVFLLDCPIFNMSISFCIWQQTLKLWKNSVGKFFSICL